MVKEKALNAIENGEICDIVHGSCYRQLYSPGKYFYYKNNLSALFNTDGIPLYKSSKVKLWPIFLAINEMPPSARFARENLIIAGLWQGKGNPPFTLYVKAFGEEINNLYSDGFEILPTRPSEGISVKLGVFCGTVDLQAKGYISNMSMFNGEYGCSTCEEPGKVVRKGKGHVRCYPYKPFIQRAPERNSDDILNVKAPQATRSSRIKGICGISGLASIPNFDIVNGLVPDYMHGVLLGVSKTLLCLRFSPVNSRQSFFAGSSISEISNRFLNMQPPDYIERLPRDLEKNYANIKATELQSWLLYYSVPCMTGFLPEEYIKHLCLFSEGIYLLLGDRITTNELQRAKQLLDRFYKDFAELYGENCIGLNVHNVGFHLASFVEKWGPLWCFPFEDANAAILQSVHGTGVVTHQYLQLKQLECKIKQVDLNNCELQEAKCFLNRMKIKGRKWSSMKKMKNCLVAGSFLPVTGQDKNQLLVLTNAQTDASLKRALRLEVNGQKLYSKNYSRTKKRICHVVGTKSGSLFAIDYFAVNLETVYAVAEKLEIEQNCYPFPTYGKHLLKVQESGDLQVFHVENITEKILYMPVGHVIYVTRLPNLLGHCVFK